MTSPSTELATTLPWHLAAQVCRLCGHRRRDHSEVLVHAPCLDCDCVTFSTVVRPNPSRSTPH